MTKVELSTRELETVTGGGLVIQSNYSKMKASWVFVDADTKGARNDGGFNVKVIQTNRN